MVAVLINASTVPGWDQVLLLALVLSVLGCLGFVSSAPRKVLVVALVAMVVGFGTAIVMAAPYAPYCDGYWKYINWLACL
jgi:hypothetical protein